MASELEISSLAKNTLNKQKREQILEEKFSKVFHFSPNPIAIIRLRDGQYIEVNKSFLSVLGYSREEIVGHTSDELNIWSNPQDRTRAIQLVTNLSNFRNEEFDCRTQSGQVKTFLASGEIISLNRQACLLISANEITERKQVKSALEKEERYLRLVLDNIPQQVFWKDANLIFLGCNKNWAEAAGLSSSAAVVGKTDYDLLPNREIAESFRNLDRKIVDTDTAQLNIVATKVRPGPEGDPIWLNINKIPLHDPDGEVIGILGVLEDITERKQVEEKLQLTQFFLDRSRDYVLFVDSEARLFYVNEAACQTLGYSKEELLNMTLHDIAPDFPVTAWDRHWEELRQKGSFTMESVHRTKDGQDISVEIAVNYLKFNGKEYNCALVRDIRDRKRAEAALQQAKEAADTANRAKSEFLAKMSHELRTPLNTILGFTQLMTSDTLNLEQQEQLGIISRSGEHLLALINDVLAMSKIEAGRITLNVTCFDLHRLLNSLEEMLQLKAKSKGLQLTFEQTPDIPQYVKADEGKLRQVLINLLGNAIKFTQQGSVILRVKCVHCSSPISHDKQPVNTLTSADKPYHQPSTINNEPSTMNFLFEIEDTGPGIAPNEIESLFDAFVQTQTGQKSQGGTGLGLSISQQFVQLMGGDITVNSSLGLGTSFRFQVPVRLAQTAEMNTIEQPQTVTGVAPGQPDYRILVVEDHKVSRLLLVKLLKRAGFHVREASNGQEAIAVWEKWQPHLIWMDMQMPVMDGYEATRLIKARGKRQRQAEPASEGEIYQHRTASESLIINNQACTIDSQHPIIIALTASAFEEDRATILAAGCDDFVSKPFRKERIFEKIGHYLGVRYLYEESADRVE